MVRLSPIPNINQRWAMDPIQTATNTHVRLNVAQKRMNIAHNHINITHKHLNIVQNLLNIN